MAKFLSKSAFAKLAGVSRQAINTAINKDKIPVSRSGTINPNHPDCQIYIKKAEENRAKRKLKKGIDANERVYNPEGGRPTEEESNTSESISRRELEARKLHAQTVNFELKNMIARGELGDIKFMEDLFFTQLSYMTTQNMTIGESLVDDLIAMALAKGEDARTKMVMKIDKKVNAINQAAENGWRRNIERVKNDLLEKLEPKENSA